MVAQKHSSRGSLGLHETSGLRILDIGAGPGYFIAAARASGYDCCGIDVPDTYFTTLERRVYSELLESIGCRRFVTRLRSSVSFYCRFMARNTISSLLF
jgi:hypothetical protein